MQHDARLFIMRHLKWLFEALPMSFLLENTGALSYDSALVSENVVVVLQVVTKSEPSLKQYEC